MNLTGVRETIRCVLIFRSFQLFTGYCQVADREITRQPKGGITMSQSQNLCIYTRKDCRDFGGLDGVVCDWEHKREMRLIDFLGELLGHGENCL